MAIAFETYDFLYETRLLLPNRVIEAKRKMAHPLTKAEVAHFEGFVTQIAASRLNDIQKSALINMALDHFGWAKKLPDADGHVNFLRTTFSTWFNTYAPAAIHICRGKGGALSMGIAVDDIVFENDRYFFRRGAADVSITDRQGVTATPVVFELQKLDHISFLISSNEAITMRHIPLMLRQLHAWFCAAICHRNDQIYADFSEESAEHLMLLLSAEAAEADRNLYPRHW